MSLAYPAVDGSVRDSLTFDQVILALNNQEMQWNVINVILKLLKKHY